MLSVVIGPDGAVRLRAGIEFVAPEHLGAGGVGDDEGQGGQWREREM
jgi:hypothetical protein